MAAVFSSESVDSIPGCHKEDNIDIKLLSTKCVFEKTSRSGEENSTLGYQKTQYAAATLDKMNPSLEFKKRKCFNIKFTNICFSIKTGFINRELKHILKSLSGEFRSGELSAIVGPSGSGKTTFMKIFSGYTEIGYSGDVCVNGHPRDISLFRSNASFVMHDTSLQSHLTVSELMNFAASLKMDNTVNAKRKKVQNILQKIDLYDNRNSKTGTLSGGELKRLAIALELVSDPPVLILDEPTSGLDSYKANQCISMLKQIAMEGRTVICTIHQPSALAFSMFDHLYAIADGRCIYSGTTLNVVPFLAELNLHCPKSYNPADYLIEIATHAYGEHNEKLVEKIRNGKNESFRLHKLQNEQPNESFSKLDTIKPHEEQILSSIQLLTAHHHSDYKTLPIIKKNTIKFCDSKYTKENIAASSHTNEIQPKTIANRTMTYKRPHKKYTTPFNQQVKILILRTFLIVCRDKSMAATRIAVHISMATLIGILYYGIGNDAHNAMNNFRYIFFTAMFIMYQGFSAILVKFPLEFSIVSREHFNRWYSLSAYYLAITLVDLPIQFACTSTFVLISYWMTKQPLEFFRIALFGLTAFLNALVGQSIGLAVSASFSLKLSAVLGPFFISPFFVFSGFFLQLKDAHPWLHWLFHISFLKYTSEGCTLAVFGYDRPKLECSKVYCHFTRPKVFLKEIGMADADYVIAVYGLLLILIILRITAFYVMLFRLRFYR